MSISGQSSKLRTSGTRGLALAVLVLIVVVLIVWAARWHPAAGPTQGAIAAVPKCDLCCVGDSLPAEYLSCEEPYPMHSWVGPDVWGPAVWDVCYWTASGFCPERRDYYRAFFKLLPYILRCNECNVNLQGVVAKRPVDPYLVSPEKLLEWVYLTHMDVRKHQRVRRSADYTFESVLKRYLPQADEQPGAARGPQPQTARRREGFAVRPDAPQAAGTASVPDEVSGAGTETPRSRRLRARGFAAAAPSATAAAAVSVPFPSPASWALHDIAAETASVQDHTTAARRARRAVPAAAPAPPFPRIAAKTVPPPPFGFTKCCKGRSRAFEPTVRALAV